MDDESYSESDISMSPSQILERLQVLRQLQLLQRGKLHKQQLQYEETTETSSSITEIVSHFSNSTSYNTFRSLLQSTHDTSNGASLRVNTTDLTPKVRERDLVDGVSVLNLSQESEFIANSPNSGRGKAMLLSRSEVENPQVEYNVQLNNKVKTFNKNCISLDDMPILSPKKDFEALILEKLQNEKNVPKPKSPKKENIFESHNKKPFLRKGEGMSRFGIRKNDLVILNTKALPWRKRNSNNKTTTTLAPPKVDNSRIKAQIPKKHEIPLIISEPKVTKSNKNPIVKCSTLEHNNNLVEKLPEDNKESKSNETNNFSNFSNSSNCAIHEQNKTEDTIKLTKGKHPLLVNKGKTWAAILTKEQNDFLTKLKQSDYYKNFTSPAKSLRSDTSYDDNLAQLCQEREKAEQNMFDLLENKVANGNLENSFFNKFMKRSHLECSGESTPLVMQKCIANNPQILNIFPDLNRQRINSVTTEQETYQSDCCSDTCSSVSTCCSCDTVEHTNNTDVSCIKEKNKKISKPMRPLSKQKEVGKDPVEKCQSDTVSENDMKSNMVEMNAKLIATSELLQDRLRELEDEIDTFRKENANLSKMREEIDLERQKFYEEKAIFEQKFNEEKILSEYYLSEEKEKLIKQKQTYERYVREIRGRLNKKERDEVANFKKEIDILKEEIRVKDAKSTSSIARLRNHVKIMEKERKDLQDEVEKLKKENRRIQHSNIMTRRLTNMKYLEEINKKLSEMSNKEARSDISLDHDVKYKSYEIERQSRSRKVESNVKGTIRPRAKSVPNLKVTSRYAKYFSQRDSVSNIERHKNVQIEKLTSNSYECDHDDLRQHDGTVNSDDNNSEIDKIPSDNEEENNLEKMYLETFKSTSPSMRSSLRHSNEGISSKMGVELENNPNAFFSHKSSSSSNFLKDSILPTQRSISPYSNTLGLNRDRSKSPISILSHQSQRETLSMPLNAIENKSNNYHNDSKSPMSVLSNSSQKHTTVIHNENYRDKLLTISPEPTTSKSSLTKTNLNPTEIKKPDGSKELRFPNGNVKHISADGKYSKFIYYNGDVKENFYNEGRMKYFYAETKTFHTTHPDGHEVLEFPDGQVEKRYKDGSSEIRLPNGSVRYHDPKNVHLQEEWRFPDGTALTISADGEQRIVFSNGQVEVHAKDHKRREFPDGTVKLVYNDGTSETRYASGRVRIKDKHGNLIMDSAPG
ncbi:hypothetical protein K1T71_011273 [Dendrolimus kikuchii]|uniref:Uncharacterized protein n=1 Tax=Dendrolimus kikuchii TaxID=765133 RepID=A0ACC1CNQ3_9NEOP|nr:hypothetical protein K1T71_011273 [Dendrolimus kikuchii]